MANRLPDKMVMGALSAVPNTNNLVSIWVRAAISQCEKDQMGRKIKDISDPGLARPHSAGAKVAFMQPCLHNQFGKIMYMFPHFWVLNYRVAERAHRRLNQYEEEILDIEISRSDDRHIYDIKLIEKIYNAGFELVANTYICFEHLTLEIIRGVYRNDEVLRLKVQKMELKDKLNYIFKEVINSPNLIKHPGYVKLFSEFEVKRHAFNHPLEFNTYDATQDWDNVPLAWIMAGKYHDGFKQIEKLLGELAKIWDKYQEDHEKPTKINIIRGIKSAHQYKKPPKRIK